MDQPKYNGGHHESIDVLRNMSHAESVATACGVSCISIKNV